MKNIISEYNKKNFIFPLSDDVRYLFNPFIILWLQLKADKRNTYMTKVLIKSINQPSVYKLQTNISYGFIIWIILTSDITFRENEQ